MPMCVGGMKRLLIMPPIDTARMALLVECRCLYLAIWPGVDVLSLPLFEGCGAHFPIHNA
jgi:hypothetical protein